MSTVDGVFRLGLKGQSPVEKWDSLNVSAPELVAHDPVNGELYWVRQDIGRGAAKIYRHDTALGKSSLVMKVKFNDSRPGPQGKPLIVPSSYRYLHVTCDIQQRPSPLEQQFKQWTWIG